MSVIPSHYHPIHEDDDDPDLSGCHRSEPCGLIRCTTAEILLIDAERSGRSVRFRVPKSWDPRDPEMTGWMTGTVVSTMLYDGISAKVLEHDPDDRIVWSVIPSCGAEVVPT